MVPFTHFITEFNKLDSDIKKIFFDFWSTENPFLIISETHWRPNVDIYATKTGVIVKSELAGVRLKDLKLLFERNKLIIKGIRHDYAAPEQITCQQVEMPYGEFERSINITHPTNKKIDSDKLKATYKDGLLLIYLPYKDIDNSKEKIEIEIK